MALKLNSSSGGSVTLQEPTTASNYTLTVPAQTATLAVNGPAFYAYNNTTQSISTNTWTKVSLTVEGFDTNNNFDSSTNYRFTPTVAGYYQISGAVYANGTNRLIVSLYKNGSELVRGTDISPTAAYSGMVSALIYFNGSTDYVELYMQSGNTTTIGYASTTTLNWMTGAMVRGA